MSEKYKLELLKEKLKQQSNRPESQIHKDLKFWIARKYLDDGVSIDEIEFEYKFAESSYNYTIPDVYISRWGGIAIYCETKLDWQWLHKFIEKNLPILKKFTSKQVMVLPKNIGGLYPHRNNKDFYAEVRYLGVELLFSNVMLKNIKKIVNVQLNSGEFDLLRNILDHANYDREDSEIFDSMYKKIMKL